MVVLQVPLSVNCEKVCLYGNVCFGTALLLLNGSGNASFHREREREGEGGDARREPMQNKTVRPADPNGKEAIYVGWRIKAAHLFSISRNNP